MFPLLLFFREKRLRLGFQKAFLGMGGGGIRMQRIPVFSIQFLHGPLCSETLAEASIWFLVLGLDSIAG